MARTPVQGPSWHSTASIHTSKQWSSHDSVSCIKPHGQQQGRPGCRGGEALNTKAHLNEPALLRASGCVRTWLATRCNDHLFTSPASLRALYTRPKTIRQSTSMMQAVSGSFVLMTLVVSATRRQVNQEKRMQACITCFFVCPNGT